MIPKIIHYCWFGKQPLPESAIKCIESWKKYCPDYKIIKWDENNCDLLLNDYVKEAYESRKWAFVSDVMRLKIIYEYGGIYLDTDVEIVKNFDELIKYDGFFGFEGKKYINTGLGFGAVKGNSLIKHILDDYEGKHFLLKDGTCDTLPCPHRNTEILKKYGFSANGKMQVINNNIVLPGEYLCPYDYETGNLCITDKTFSIHHYDASWQSEEEKERSKICSTYIRKYGKIMGKMIYCLKFLGVHKIIKLIYSKIFTYR